MKFFFIASLLAYLLGTIKYFIYLTTRKQFLFSASTVVIAVGFALHTVALGLRSAHTGHGPYMLPFEYFSFFSWCIVLTFLIAEVKYKIKDLGSFVIPLALLLQTYSWFLPWDGVMITHANRFWLTLHQTTALLGFSAMALTFAVGVMFIVQERQLKSKHLGPMYYKLPSLDVLDNVNRVAIDFGFPLITIGVVSGMIWGHQSELGLDMSKAWINILCWMIYGVIFFGRITAGWRGRRAAGFGVVGFGIVIIGYIIHIY